MGPSRSPLCRNRLTRTRRAKRLSICYAILFILVPDDLAPVFANESEVSTDAPESAAKVAINDAFDKGDFPTAIRLLKQEAEAGNAKAQRLLGAIYLQGEIVAENPVEAARWLGMAANQGDVGSQLVIGKMYLAGTGVAKSEIVAAQYWEQAAAQGDAEAAFELGKLFDPGYFVGDKPRITIVGKEPPLPPNKVPKNASEAAKWYEVAAHLGSSGAQYNLGNFYAEGNGVPRNYAEAANLFRLAARQGEPMAQTNLGGLYSQGLGVPLNNYKAYMWSTIAAASGMDLALTNRELVAEKLTKSERASAEQLAAKCVEIKFQDIDCN